MTDPLRVGFAGTPAFAARALEALLAAPCIVALVLTQPDRPKGRGLAVEPSEVKRVAAAHGIPVLQPASLRTAEAREPLLAVPLDVLVVAAYGLILPREVLAWPRFGCLNVHASLLPRWRGAAPIARAIEAGDTRTGVSIMRMDEGLDTGPVVSMHPVPIDARETAGSLHDRLAVEGAVAIVEAIARLARERALPAQPQPATGATYAAKLTRADAAIDWSQLAAAIDRRIRACDPYPGAVTAWAGMPLKVWRAEPTDLPRDEAVAPGTVVAVAADGIDVAAGRGTLRVVTVQPAAGRRMPAAAFAAGHGVRPGSRFGVIP